MPATRRQFLGGFTKPASLGLGLEDKSLPASPAPTPSLAVHAANRLMFGPRPGSYDASTIATMGYDAFLNAQLSPSTIADTEFDFFWLSMQRDTYNNTWAQLWDRRGMSYTEAVKPITQVRYQAVVRRVLSRKQLLERMVEFWFDHFSIYGWDDPQRSLWTEWDKTIRANALGNFRTFLEATGTHPCMLFYLDGVSSTDAGPNENYARELFELHTLGIEAYNAPGGYVDNDVYEASRCFTGWTVEQSSTAATRGQFKYVAEDHDRFQKIVLGRTIPNDQVALKDGRDVFDLVASHPATARHICRKLCIRFIGDDPPESIVTSATTLWLSLFNDTQQIGKVLRHILSSNEFKDPATFMTKFKRPGDWMISAVRALGIATPLHDSFWWNYTPMGHAYYEWRPPDGPPDDSAYWMSSLNMLYRWNYIWRLAAGWYTSNGFDYNVTAMPTTINTTRGIVEFWAPRVMGRTASQATLDALMTFVAEGRGWDNVLPAQQITDKVKLLAGLCALAPEFMRR